MAKKQQLHINERNIFHIIIRQRTSNCVFIHFIWSSLALSNTTHLLIDFWRSGPGKGGEGGEGRVLNENSFNVPTFFCFKLFQTISIFRWVYVLFIYTYRLNQWVFAHREEVEMEHFIGLTVRKVPLTLPDFDFELIYGHLMLYWYMTVSIRLIVSQPNSQTHKLTTSILLCEHKLSMSRVGCFPQILFTHRTRIHNIYYSIEIICQKK